MMMQIRYPIRSIWDEMDRMQKEMDDLVGVVRRPQGKPALNIWSNEENLLVTAELPGVELKDVDVNVVGDTLTIKGSRAEEEFKEDVSIHRQERENGEFSRTVTLPFMVNADRVEASLQNGVLRILLPRAEEDKPRRIMVKTS